MHELVARCLEEEPNAWADLWLIYEQVAAAPVRSLLRRCGFHTQDAEDATIGIFAHLFDDNCQRLRSFHGSTDAELDRWLVQVACNYTKNWIDHEIRRVRRERVALGQAVIGDRDGLTEKQVERMLRELEEIGERQDAARLRILAGLAPHRDTPKRTLRQWAHDLKGKLRGGA